MDPSGVICLVFLFLLKKKRIEGQSLYQVGTSCNGGDCINSKYQELAPKIHSTVLG